jgi:cytochrome-b5 reductase
MTVITKKKKNRQQRKKNKSCRNNYFNCITQNINNYKNNNPLFISIFISILISVPLLLSVFTFDISNNNTDDDMQNSAAVAAGVVSAAISPYVKQSYKLLVKTKLSHDSFLLRYGLPTTETTDTEGGRRKFLGIDPLLPTCIKIDYNNPENEIEETGTNKKSTTFLSKSYSPISHPSQQDYFDLIVKSYDTTYDNGGGVGNYLCEMTVGESITAELKKERIVHTSSNILNRGWKNIGLIAGGTGIAPLLQLARLLLFDHPDQNQNQDNQDENHNQELLLPLPKIYLLFINCTKRDILGKNEIELLQQKYPNNFFVTYSFTQEGQEDDEDDTENSSATYVKGRGDVTMALSALPPPPLSKSSSKTDSDTDSDTDSADEESSDTMIFICGRDGFVSHWAGPVSRGPPPPGKKKKGPKIQGPLLGILNDAGYQENNVFKY